MKSTNEKFFKGLERNFYNLLVRFAQDNKALDDEKLIDMLKNEAHNAMRSSIASVTHTENVNMLASIKLEELAKLSSTLRGGKKPGSKEKTLVDSSSNPGSPTSGSESMSSTDLKWAAFDRAVEEHYEALDLCAKDMIKLAKDTRLQSTSFEKVAHTSCTVFTALTCLLVALGFMFRGNSKMLGCALPSVLKDPNLLATVSLLGFAATKLDAYLTSKEDNILMQVVRRGDEMLGTVELTCMSLIETLNEANPSRESKGACR